MYDEVGAIRRHDYWRYYVCMYTRDEYVTSDEQVAVEPDRRTVSVECEAGYCLSKYTHGPLIATPRSATFASDGWYAATRRHFHENGRFVFITTKFSR